MADEKHRIVTIFKDIAVKNEAKSKAEGRPIYDSVEAVEIVTAGDRNSVKVFPAHAEAGWITTQDGTQEPVTYAMKYADQYRRFKEGKQQVQDGTPVEELPFLSKAKCLELKALRIYTAETLASLDGQNLKTIGQGGRELKNQAQAYLDRASGSASVTAIAAENEGLKEQIRLMQEQINAINAQQGSKSDETDGAEKSPSPFDDWEDNDIKEYIAAETGTKPRGNPNHETLVAMADELEANKAA